MSLDLVVHAVSAAFRATSFCLDRQRAAEVSVLRKVEKTCKIRRCEVVEVGDKPRGIVDHNAPVAKPNESGDVLQDVSVGRVVP